MIKMRFLQQAATGGSFGRHHDEIFARQSGRPRQFQKSTLRLWRSLAGLHNDLIPRDDRLDDLNAQKLNGIVPRADDADSTQRNPPDQAPLAKKPPWSAREAMISENAARSPRVPTARRDQRHHFRGDGLPRRFSDFGFRQCGKRVEIRRDQFAETTRPRSTLSGTRTTEPSVCVLRFRRSLKVRLGHRIVKITLDGYHRSHRNFRRL
jgi:hypothetical protein